MAGPILTLLPSEIKKEFRHGKRLDEALLDMNHPLSTPCGGRGLCGKCRITAAGGLSGRTDAEKRLLPDDSMRLACQATLEGDATVHLAGTSVTQALSVRLPEKVPPVCIAIDMGTTTIQVAAVHPVSGDILHHKTILNPQRSYGHDVISRISAASNDGSRFDLSRLLRTGITGAAMTLLEEINLHPADISCMAASGNTTMSYFLLGLGVSSLGVHPYRATVRDFEGFTSSILNLADVPMYVLPSASAFIGGDLVGGMALLDTGGTKENTFFIDLGTNGEMFLRTHDDRIFATSCAMGPALEGMNISHGMTADEGAITHARILHGSLVMDVTGGGKAAGISGTGLIDLVSLMLQEGSVTSSGSFGISGQLFSVDAANGIISITDGISVSRQDIRNLQLAKGASLSAARILLKQACIDTRDIKNVVIAGAFGEHLDLANFKKLGFLPDFPEAVYSFRGNTSLLSAARACCDKKFIVHAERLRDRTSVIELSIQSDFQNVFMDSLNF